MISKALKLPEIENERFYREYLPSFDNTIHKKINQNSFIKFVDSNKINEIFFILLNITKRLNYTTTVIFLDKVDETYKLRSNVKEITRRLMPLVTENRLMLNPNFGVVFMLWNKPRI